MCGIAVFFNLEEPQQKMAKALNAMIHRGPDDHGMVPIRNGMMGMRRLSIVDPQGGAQPLFNEDQSLSLVCNGEIVNCRELEKDLRSRHQFRTRSDAEVLLHGYEEMGVSFFERLQGMFAFCLYDARKELLFLLRDPFGIKPLYYIRKPFFAAASEIKALLSLLPEKPKLHLASLHRHLTFLYDPTEETVFSGIRKLPPGVLLQVDPSTQALKFKKLSFFQLDTICPSFTEAIERTEALLRETTRKHLLSDVPVGAFLSGGVDSSLIAALAQKEQKELHSFSIGFPGFGIYDETPFALKAASQIQSFHHSFRCPLDFARLPSMVYALEEPVADAAFVPFFHLCEAVSPWVKVALSGLGGDELFFGYYRYFLPLLPGVPAARSLHVLLERLPFDSTTKTGDFIRLMKKLVPQKRYSFPAGDYLKYNTFFQSREREMVYGEALRPYVKDDPIEAFSSLTIPLACRDKVGQWVDVHTYLPGDTLFVADKISMAHSLEVRVPFLYGPLLGYALSLPVSFHCQWFSTKRCLKAVARKHLPPAIVNRKKHGFSVPVDQWIRGEGLKILRKVFTPRRVKKLKLFDYQGIWKMIDAHLSGKVDYSQHIFQLLIFDLFHRIFLENSLDSFSDQPLEDCV